MDKKIINLINSIALLLFISFMAYIEEYRLVLLGVFILFFMELV
jgi:hypothetical protein